MLKDIISEVERIMWDRSRFELDKKEFINISSTESEKIIAIGLYGVTIQKSHDSYRISHYLKFLNLSEEDITQVLFTILDKVGNKINKVKNTYII